MRPVVLAMAVLGLSVARADEVVFDLEWGFGPKPSEIYWDGTFEVRGGQLVSLKAVSFETDRHDRLNPPGFQSFTLDEGTDGMVVTVAGDDDTTVRLQSREGAFSWTVGKGRRAGQLTFPSRSQGRLVVRTRVYLGGTPRRLSDTATQDCDPAACRLEDGSTMVVWRAFVGLPEEGREGGDQIRVLMLDARGKPGRRLDLLKKPGDVEAISVVPERASTCRVVWAERREDNWDLYAASLRVDESGIERTSTMRLTEHPGVDRSPRLIATPDGALILVWQAWRERRSSIRMRMRREGNWDETLRLSAGDGNAWDPAIAVAGDGSVAVAWSAWRGTSYDVDLRVAHEGTWSPVEAVAAGERYEARPSLAFDRAGALWIAYEEGRAGWGMDSHDAGLRSERNLRLRVLRQGVLLEPTGTAALNLPRAFAGRSEMAHLAGDGRGALWLLFRSLGARGVWTIFGSTLAEEGWSPPVALRASAGGQDVRLATTSSPRAALLAVWVSDHRTRQVGGESHVYAAELPVREPRASPVDGRPVTARPVSDSEDTLAKQRPTTMVGERRLGLYFGDLHRHTELSVCRTAVDGSLEDAHRYAIDAAGLDFLCVTDHVQHVKILDDFDLWRTGKTADLNRIPDLHLPFYGYERSQRWPYGHRNIIGLRRHPKRVPRTADNRPWDANSGYTGEMRLPPPELWSRLFGQNVITIPHTSANPTMGTSFGHRPPAIEPVVEIYQGCRISYEHAGAPDPRGKRDSSRFGGATKAGGFIWDALAKGYRYGFIASSDHVATHNAFACVWAESFSNASILESLTRRRCYAATDRIVCDMRMGEQLMGAEFDASEVPPLGVSVSGTAELERIDIIRDNKLVYTRRPATPSRQESFTYRDLDASPGTHYYYARVIQQDGNMAWVTPIWVNVKPPSD